MTHICEVCRRPFTEHGKGELIPLCCDGCPCGETLAKRREREIMELPFTGRVQMSTAGTKAVDVTEIAHRDDPDVIAEISVSNGDLRCATPITINEARALRDRLDALIARRRGW